MREALELAKVIGKKLGHKDQIFHNLQYLGRVAMTRIIYQRLSHYIYIIMKFFQITLSTFSCGKFEGADENVPPR